MFYFTFSACLLEKHSAWISGFNYLFMKKFLLHCCCYLEQCIYQTHYLQQRNFKQLYLRFLQERYVNENYCSNDYIAFFCCCCRPCQQKQLLGNARAKWTIKLE